MLPSWADHRNPTSWAARLRGRRFEVFRALARAIPHRPVSILDVGGRVQYWQAMREAVDDWQVTLANIEPPSTSVPPWMAQIAADARALPFPDRSFDVVFSNSVIEHVGGEDDRRAMAAEVRRVGCRYVVQTPNRYFPIEPHFLVPGFQFLPVAAQALLAQRFALGWFDRAKSAEAARALVESVHLLTHADMQRLFPDGHVMPERVAGLTKSWIAYGGWNGHR